MPFPRPTVAPVVNKTVEKCDITNAKEMTEEERNRLFELTVERLMNAESRVQQAGAEEAHHKLLVRIVSRFSGNHDYLDEKLANFIIEQHEKRADLAVLWVAEMYQNYHEFSMLCVNKQAHVLLTQEERLARYNKVIVLLLKNLYEKKLHTETIFKRIFLEAPLLNPDAFSYLKLACYDTSRFAFGISTLRELFISQCKQKSELIHLLLELTTNDNDEIRAASVETVKELVDLPNMRERMSDEADKMHDSLPRDIRSILSEILETSKKQMPSETKRKSNTKVEEPEKKKERYHL